MLRILLTVLFIGCITMGMNCSEDKTVNPEPEKELPGHYKAHQAVGTMTIDGVADEADWDQAGWAPIDQLWLGVPVSENDFKGRFKALWSTEKLFLWVEITDDLLQDTHPNPTSSYWEDDCLEIFLDEDHSGGIHQYNYNAFAYHVALDYNVADIGTDRQVHLYNDHLTVKRKVSGNIRMWEFAVTIYNDQFVYGAQENPTVPLVEGKKMGFMLAYCDSDGSGTRESFIGSIMIQGNDKNLGWVDASVFGTMELVK